MTTRASKAIRAWSICAALSSTVALPIYAAEADRGLTMQSGAPGADTYGLTGMGASGNTIHMFPSPISNAFRALEAANTAPPPLTYHGGPIMKSVRIYTIFWIPPTLQDGSATGVSAKYIAVNNRALADYPANGIDNNNTQYYQTLPTTYIANVGGFGKTFTDTSPYPASGCHDDIGGKTTTNCITDVQMQAEITKVIASQSWPNGGLNNIFFLYTSSGEGSCFNSSSTACAYTQYCAYHSSMGTQPIIYAVEPYGYASLCNTAVPSPNGDPDADTATTSSSHELSESITDPKPYSGWSNSANSEIGDLCAYNYGPNTWDGGLANQKWNGHLYELQQEWDNHRSACVQVGP